MSEIDKFALGDNGHRASPLTIIIMLACYYSPAPSGEIDSDRWNSSAGNSIREWLRQQHLIDDNDKATERGCAWVEYICRTPLPEQKWILPERSNLP